MLRAAVRRQLSQRCVAASRVLSAPSTSLLANLPRHHHHHRRLAVAAPHAVAVSRSAGTWRSSHTAASSSTASASSRTQAPAKELLVNGLPLRDLASLPTRAIIDRYGRARYRNAAKTLPQQLLKLVDQQQQRQQQHMSVARSRGVLKQVFGAADKCNAPQVMQAALRALEVLATTAPDQQPSDRRQQEQEQQQQVNQPLLSSPALLNTLYNALHRTEAYAAMVDEYTRARQRLPREGHPVPEVVNRLGLMGLLGTRDLAGVQALLREMQHRNEPVTVEMSAQLVRGLASAGEHDAALQVFARLQAKVTSMASTPASDAQPSVIHEVDVIAVLQALGHMGRAQDAFQFYRDCRLPLSGALASALLAVCLENPEETAREATAILRNCERFAVPMDRDGYTRVLQALEVFERGEDTRHERIAVVLREMRARGLRATQASRAIEQRHRARMASRHRGASAAQTVDRDGDGDGGVDVAQGVDVDAELMRFQEEMTTAPEKAEKVLHGALALAVAHGRAEAVPALLDHAQAHGLRVRQREYVRAVAAMKSRNRSDLARAGVPREQRLADGSHSCERYGAEDVAALWRDAQTRGVRIENALLSASCQLLAQGTADQRALLWSAFVAIEDEDEDEDEDEGGNGRGNDRQRAGDGFELRTVVYEQLLRVVAQDGASADCVRVFDAATRRLAATGRSPPPSMVVQLIDKLTAPANADEVGKEDDVDEAVARVLAMRRAPMGAVASVLRALVRRDATDPRAATMLALLADKKALPLFTATALVNEMAAVALTQEQEREKQKALAALVGGVVRAYDRGRVGDAMNTMAWKRVVKNRRGLRMHRAFYETALRLQEERGEQAEELRQRLGALARCEQVMGGTKVEEEEQAEEVGEKEKEQTA